MATYLICSRCGHKCSNDTGVEIMITALVECYSCLMKTRGKIALEEYTPQKTIRKRKPNKPPKQLSDADLQLIVDDVTEAIKKFNRRSFRKVELTKVLQKKWSAGDIQVGLGSLLFRGIIEFGPIVLMEGKMGRKRSKLYRVKNFPLE